MMQSDLCFPPTGLDVELLPAGRWWDAIRVSGPLASRVMEVLGDASGSVIEDSQGRQSYWLVRVGSINQQDLVRGAMVLSQNEREITYISVPPTHKVVGPGPHWSVPPGPDRRYLTPSHLLCEALRAVADVLATAGPEQA